jgi:L-fuconolactonase
MKIDAHHHLWKYNEREYGWMDASMQVLRRDYLPEDLEGEISQAGVDATVAVQARQTIEETRWLLELTGRYPFICGIVGWLDLQSPELESQLAEFASHPALVGVRHVVHDEADDDFMLRPAFLKGLERLGVHGLAYDLLLFPKHLSRAVKVARKFPDQRFVLDHISKPPVSTGGLQPWKEDMEALAACPNIWCKVSGMVTEADHADWKYEDFLPYLDAVTTAFGSDRLMVGSDWPVCRLAATYNEAMDIPSRFFRHLPSGEQEKIFGLNAINCYQLNTDTNG